MPAPALCFKHAEEAKARGESLRALNAPRGDCTVPGCEGRGYYVPRHENPGEVRHRRVLDAGKAQDIFRRVRRGEPPGRVARDYGIHNATVRAIRDGRIWKDATAPLRAYAPDPEPAEEPGETAPRVAETSPPAAWPPEPVADRPAVPSEASQGILARLTRVSGYHIPAAYGWRSGSKTEVA